MITDQDVTHYREQGYLVVDQVLTVAEVAQLRADLATVLDKASSVTANTDIYDLEVSHTPENPRVRRVKIPHTVMPSANALMRHPRMVSILTRLIGPGVRFQTSKLNLKSADYGAAVEWHQDWAFYPHTNDDLLAVGVMLDDVDQSNGAMMVLPGSHKGPIYDHHTKGYFCGAIDPGKDPLDFSTAVPLTGKAGSMTFHHVRLVHGSAPNRSKRSRNFLLYQFTAADAWPLVQPVQDLTEYDQWLVAGEPTLQARLTAVPVRMPLPPSPKPGSIYENQSELANPYFGEHGDHPEKIAAS